MVNKSKTNNFPSGEAWRISKMLKERYTPQDLQAKTELRVALNKVRMSNKHQEPARMFEELAVIETTYNTATYEIPQYELMAVVMQLARST
jgi:hypothetical protein